MEQQVNTSDLKKTKKPLLITVLFLLTSIITFLEVYLIFDRMIFAEDVNQSLQMFSKALSVEQYYLIIGALVLFILIKWAGSLLMFIKKAWGYILYIIPNVLLAASLTLAIIYNFRTINIYAFLALTVLFIVFYTIAFSILRKRKKQNLL